MVYTAAYTHGIEWPYIYRKVSFEFSGQSLQNINRWVELGYKLNLIAK